MRVSGFGVLMLGYGAKGERLGCQVYASWASSVKKR